MLKKIVTSLGVVLLLTFASCGGGSTKAKELLQKILQFVGIPQSIVVNVCQDSNKNGICGTDEIFTKVTINKGDNIDNILEKISLTDDGKYFLETYNPSIPIIVELQDETKVDYDNGKFALTFNGFQTNENNETKEVSILESIIDADALTKKIADKFRTLYNTEAQEKYYVMLLNVLETNINTLRANELDKQKSMSATIKEMGDETKTNQDKANSINACGSDQVCVDNEIKKLSDELLITDEEAQQIKKNYNISNQPSPEENNKNLYKLWDYRFPKNSRNLKYKIYDATEDGKRSYSPEDFENFTGGGKNIDYEISQNQAIETLKQKETIVGTETFILENNKVIGSSTSENNDIKVGEKNDDCYYSQHLDSISILSYTYTDVLEKNCNSNNIKIYYQKHVGTVATVMKTPFCVILDNEGNPETYENCINYSLLIN